MISTLELPLHAGTINWKLKNFYDACMNLDNVVLDAARPLTNIISELGGWHILRDWSEVDFDGMKVLTVLQVQYGVNPFFKVHVEPDPHVPEKNCIRISPAGLGLPDRNYYYRDDRILTAYMDYIRDVVISLSSTRNKAAKFGRDIFNYEKRIAEITPDLANLQNPITTYNAVSLAELKLTTSTIPFHDILQALYPKVSISENTEVIVTSQEYLSELAQIISSTDRHTMNGYLIWCLVREYLPFLSEVYTSALDSFNNELFGISKSNKRWEVCVKWVREFMSLATEFHLEKIFPIAEATKQSLNETFRTILEVIKKKLDTFGQSVLLKDQLAAKLNTLSLQIGLPSSAKNLTYLKEYYNPLIVFKMNLFDSIKSSIPLTRKVDERLLMNSLPQGVLIKELLKDVPKVRYIPSENAIIIPRALVMEPFVEDGYPRPVIYGRLGTEIASAILSAILPYGSLWTADKKILSPFHTIVAESLKSVQSNVQCISTYLSQNVDPLFAPQKEVALSAFVELFAVKVANEALLSGSNNHVHYSGLEQYEDSALYFLTYAQTRCSESTKQYQLYQSSLYFMLESKDLLEMAWTNLAEFRQAFDCASSKSSKCFEVVPK
ncbi:protein gone early isoform X2 [Dendroctonus ponderosae]|nr:protein gone early isoform X2 [Dendroctonus ponderosae]